MQCAQMIVGALRVGRHATRASVFSRHVTGKTVEMMAAVVVAVPVSAGKVVRRRAFVYFPPVMEKSAGATVVAGFVVSVRGAWIAN